MSEAAVPDRLSLEFQSAIAGRYALERELGRGGMGIVYLARDLRLERPVAIKLLPPTADRALRERFGREARLAARLSHPHIVPIHAVEETGDFVFFVMSYIAGETLGARVRRDGPLRAAAAARVLREVAWALAYAHAQGVVHRDVKADNILLEQASGRALVVDFGIARPVQASGVSGEGRITGTPEYMSPEQASGEAVDGRSDLYALGVVGYLALSSRLPFEATNVTALLAQHVTKPPPPLVAPGAPRALVAAVERCLAKDPAQRFQSGEELADALGAALEAPRDLPMPVRAFLAGTRPEARARFVAPFLLGAVLIPSALGFLLDLVFPGLWPPLFRAGVIGLAATFVGIGIVSPLAVELLAIRRLLAAGFTRGDLDHAIQREVRRRREELEYAYGGSPTRWEHLMRLKSWGSVALVAAGAIGAFLLPYPAVQAALGAFVLGTAAALVTGFAAYQAARRRLDVSEQKALRSWRGWWGRLLFKLAGLGLRRTPSAMPPEDRPTEMALGLAALDLFHALPNETRRALGDVPGVLRSLEQDAQRLRRAAADSGPARDVAATRLREALNALEAVRLDLLRLHGGVGTVDGLTQDLEAARGVGEEVDRLLEGIEETEG